MGEKIRREELEREFRENDSEKCHGTQVSVPECVMQKRFPAAGESHIHNALRVSRLGGRKKRDGLRMICHDSELPDLAITAPPS